MCHMIYECERLNQTYNLKTWNKAFTGRVVNAKENHRIKVIFRMSRFIFDVRRTYLFVEQAVRQGSPGRWGSTGVKWANTGNGSDELSRRAGKRETGILCA